MKPSVMKKHMEEATATDFMGMLTNPAFMQQEKLAKANAQNNNIAGDENKDDTTQKTKGRPKKKDSEISDEGDQTRSQGTNIGRGGKI